MFLVELGCHEFGGSKYWTRVRIIHRSWQTQVANSYVTRIRVDEYVVTLQVSVNNGQRLFVEVNKAGKDWLAPAFYYAQLRYFVFLYISPKSSTRDFSNKHDFFFFLVLPPRNKVDNIGMIQTLD